MAEGPLLFFKQAVRRGVVQIDIVFIGKYEFQRPQGVVRSRVLANTVAVHRLFRDLAPVDGRGIQFHLNAEEKPEQADYPKDPEFCKRFGPRGVIHSYAMPDGTQNIEDTGPLTRKRMETIDDDVAARAAAFIEEQHKAGKPIFVWVNFTHMHFRAHSKPASIGQSGRWQSE